MCTRGHEIKYGLMGANIYIYQILVLADARRNPTFGQPRYIYFHEYHCPAIDDVKTSGLDFSIQGGCGGGLGGGVGQGRGLWGEGGVISDVWAGVVVKKGIVVSILHWICCSQSQEAKEMKTAYETVYCITPFSS